MHAIVDYSRLSGGRAAPAGLAKAPSIYAPTRIAAPARSSSRLWLMLALAAASASWVLTTAPVARDRLAHAAAPMLRAAGVQIGAPAWEIAEVHARRGETNGQNLLMVEGAVWNRGRQAQAGPELQIAINGKDGRPIYTWKAKAAAATVDPAGSAPFRARLLAPPAAFESLTVSLAEKG